MAKSFLKKTPEPEVQVTKKAVYSKEHDVFFVNPEKYDRARETLALILGERIAQKAEDVERKEHYTKQLAKHSIDPKSPEALPALYEIFGGLLRSKSEQEVAEKKAEEMMRKAKKKAIE